MGLALSNHLRQFARDVRTQKLRLALTIFGIVWGTAAVTLLLAFGEGLHRQVSISQKGLGDAIIIAWPSRTSKPYQGLPRGRLIQANHEDIELVRRSVSEIDRISEEYNRNATRIGWGAKTVGVDLGGVNAEFGEMRNIIASAGGRWLNQQDMEERRRVVFLGDELATDLFGEKGEPVGKTVRVDQSPFLVIGVMQPKNQDSSYGGRDHDKAFIPASTYRAIYGAKYVGNFVFQVEDTTQVEAAKKKVTATLAGKHRFDPTDENAVAMWDTTEGMKFLDTFFIAFRAFLGIVGALTLVVGGIGVSNIMNVAVEERTKEIGIKMALGAKRRFVIGQFLTETLFITIVGGALGFLVAWSICAVFPKLGFSQYVGDPVISLQVAVTTTAVLGAIGVLAGWFPARTAANLRPVEALKM